jgi:hypothetical protein
MKKKTFSFRIHGIDLVEKSMFKGDVKDEDVFNYDVKAQLVGHPRTELIVAFVSVKIKKNESEDILAKVIIGVGFNIKDYENSFEKDSQGIHIVPTELEIMLKSIAISTMRGVLFSEFRGTPLHKAFLPIISPDTMQPVKGNNLLDL